jgi:hypothetical protein
MVNDGETEKTATRCIAFVCGKKDDKYKHWRTSKCARANASSSVASAAVASALLPGSRRWAAKNLSTARREISLVC